MKNDVKALTESAMMVGIAVVIATLANFGLTFLYVLLPFPFMVLAIRKGTRYSVMAYAVTMLIVFMFSGFMNTLFCLMFGPMTIVMGYLLEKKKSAFYVILWGSVAMLISTVIMLYVSQAITGITVYDELEQFITESFQITESMTSDAELTKDAVEEMQTTFDSIRTQILMLMPFSLLMFGVLEAYVSYLLMYFIGKRFKIFINPLKDISRFMISRDFAIAIILMYLASYIMMYSGYNNADALLLNIGAIGRMALVIQGLGLIKWWMMKKKISTVFMLVVIVLLPLLTGVITFLAMFDFIFDFRHIRIKA